MVLRRRITDLYYEERLWFKVVLTKKFLAILSTKQWIRIARRGRDLGAQHPQPFTPPRRLLRGQLDRVDSHSCACYDECRLSVPSIVPPLDIHVDDFVYNGAGGLPSGPFRTGLSP
jgi:hypothetical protein